MYTTNPYFHILICFVNRKELDIKPVPKAQQVAYDREGVQENIYFGQWQYINKIEKKVQAMKVNNSTNVNKQ